MYAEKRLDSLLESFQRVPLSFSHMMSEISLFGCNQPGVSPGLPMIYVCAPYLTLCVL